MSTDRPDYISRKIRRCCCPECTEPHERKELAASPTESGSWNLTGIDPPPTGNYKQWALIEDAPRVIIDWGYEHTYPRRFPISPTEYILDWGEIVDGVMVDLPDTITHDYQAKLYYVCECYPLESCKNWGTCESEDDTESDYCKVYPVIVPPANYDQKYKNFKYWAILNGGYPMGTMIASGTIADDGTLTGLPAVNPAHSVHIACCPIEVCRPYGNSAIVLGTNIGQAGTVIDLKPYKYANGVDGDFAKYAPNLYCYLLIRDFDPQIKQFGGDYCAGNYAYRIGIGGTDSNGYIQAYMPDEYDMGHNSVAVVVLVCSTAGCYAPIPDDIPNIPYAVIGYGTGAEVANLLSSPGLAPPGTHVSIYQISSNVCCMDLETGRTPCASSSDLIPLPLLYSDQMGVLRDSDCNIPDLSELASADPCHRFAVTNYSEICRNRNTNGTNDYDPGCGGDLRSQRTTSNPYTTEVVRQDIQYDVTFIRSWRTGTSITFEWEMNLPDINPYIDQIADRIPGTQVTFTDGQNFEYGWPSYCGVTPWRSGVPPQLAIINSNNRYVDDGYWCDPSGCGDAATSYRLVNARDNVITWFTEYTCSDPPEDPGRDGVIPLRYLKWRDDIEVYV